ncbi:helix-turn-helix domain-containing protein [Halorhabdus sp. CUG00001]|uniref:ArsR/SmtB family transcription factor n=1 Tax=Halorhabdus sp. CUG00001 TaxID=2600297 RepID=UPI00131DC628|nr:helix-turn-helix domain-containing protein [Halorhabdus sp. CUG00001]
MGTLLPRRGERTETADEPRVLGLSDEAADEAFAALSSQTARQVLALVYEDPATPVEIRDEIGTSLQNVHYHVEKLEGAELIESVGTDYSAKGNEMSVYAPTSEALVLVAGEQEDQSLLKRAVARVLAGVGVLAGGAVAFGVVANQWLDGETTQESGGQIGIQATETGSEEGLAALLTDPAVAFFLGGAFLLVLVGAWWTVRTR